MRPPWSMVIFTVLAGLGQGLLVMLILEQWGSFSSQAPATDSLAFLGPSMLAFGLLFAGLISAFFHLAAPRAPGARPPNGEPLGSRGKLL
jgi:DMSO reductase anchor subunit (DmsC).